MIDHIAVIIMCKAPVVGRVKTRLIPPYTADEACAFHKAMAQTVIERISRIFSKTYVATDDASHPFFEQFDLPLLKQGEGDLGERMSRLMVNVFNDGAQAVLFLGADSPHMPQSRLAEVAVRLKEYDVVIGPVEDGGYDLIAMNRVFPELFNGITWSSEQVLSQTMQKAEALAISVSLLDESFDLDTAECIERAKPLWQPPIPSVFSPVEKVQGN
jgi:rSAM/selenodomain-associated transferase 1